MDRCSDMKAIIRTIAAPFLLLWLIIVATIETVILGKQPDPDMAD